MSGVELESSELVEYIGSKYVTEVGAKVVSEFNIDIKFRVHAGISDKVARLDLSVGPRMMVTELVS